MSLTAPTIAPETTNETSVASTENSIVPPIPSQTIPASNSAVDAKDTTEKISQNVGHNTVSEVDNRVDVPETNTSEVVRVMAYLAAEEAQILDDLWFRLRRLPSRPSKSDLLRAALLVASENEENLTAMLTQQRTNTLSRQRARKGRE